ncbi:MAG: glycosyltransferase family 9 protein [Candidatus Omnitrophota bacterium]|nr:MAG: glycosyltransferase family 9 protein [Candidatus Omnitrophota bacterium]
MFEINKDKIRRILVIRTDKIGRMGPAARYYGLGEALLNIPAIRALKQNCNASVLALVNPAVAELLRGAAEIDQILIFDENRWRKNPFARLKLIWQLRRMRFDLAVIFNPTKRFHILSFFAGIPERLGYDRKWSFLLTHKIEDKKSLGQKHEVEYNLDLVRHIGIDTDEKKISIAIDKEDNRFVENLLSKYAIRDKDLIFAIHPHSSNPAKTWPKENFAYVIDALRSKFAAKVVVIGAAGESSAVNDLISLTKYRPVNLSGKLTLKQLAAFLKKCALLISNDSGPVHIAAAMERSVIAIFGRNDPGVGPVRWGPWGEGHIILHKHPGCEPCLDRSCPRSFKCLSLTTPEEVLKAVENRLSQ